MPSRAPKLRPPSLPPPPAQILCPLGPSGPRELARFLHVPCVLSAPLPQPVSYLEAPFVAGPGTWHTTGTPRMAVLTLPERRAPRAPFYRWGFTCRAWDRAQSSRSRTSTAPPWRGQAGHDRVQMDSSQCALPPFLPPVTRGAPGGPALSALRVPEANGPSSHPQAKPRGASNPGVPLPRGPTAWWAGESTWFLASLFPGCSPWYPQSGRSHQWSWAPPCWEAGLLSSDWVSHPNLLPHKQRPGEGRQQPEVTQQAQPTHQPLTPG